MKLTIYTWLALWNTPQDGTRRYLCDIWQPLALLLLTICFTVTFFVVQDPYTASKDDFFCNADGRVVKQVIGEYKPLWDPKLYFTINMAFGTFSFTDVKVIDACWDTVVGRGGQMLVALVAYRVLRRSLTLIMEKCAIAIPTITSLYCQKLQFTTIWQLLCENLSHWNPRRSRSRGSKLSAKTRLVMQAAACTYVMTFATLASVMTGYRADLTGFFDYTLEQASELKPLSQIQKFSSSLVLYQGERAGLSKSPLLAGSLDLSHGANGTETLTIDELLSRIRDVEEPYGVLFDYALACFALKIWVNGEMRQDSYAEEKSSRVANSTGYSLSCAVYECTCSLPAVLLGLDMPLHDVLDSMTSSITIDGTTWKNISPPLNISIKGNPLSAFDPWSSEHQTLSTKGRHFQDVRDFWNGYVPELPKGQNYWSPSGRLGRWYPEDLERLSVYKYNNATILDEEFITRTGRCIAESDEAYSWGFSSLLLFTFCCYTICFALVLIALQSDVYWNSRNDRAYESPSIYADILYLAEKLKEIVDRESQSARAVDEDVKNWKQGVRLEMQGLPHSRAGGELKVKRVPKVPAAKTARRRINWRYRGIVDSASQQDMRQPRSDAAEDARSASQIPLVPVCAPLG